MKHYTTYFYKKECSQKYHNELLLNLIDKVWSN
jgi:hypothetical protein